jgi:xanthine dehydrogenase accessory factor
MDNMFGEIQAALSRGERVVVATVIKAPDTGAPSIGKRFLLRADGSITGSLGIAALDQRALQDGAQVMKDGRPRNCTYYLEADASERAGLPGTAFEVFIEMVRPEQRLIIAGGGYVAQALARLMAPLDFRLIVVDDRRDLVNPETFPAGVELRFGDIPEAIRSLEPDRATWIVIVTRGHHSDKDALRAALTTQAGYIGMISSPSKSRRILHDLLREGVLRERLESVHAPIGLDLGAETPDEIALSIAAEMLMLRHHATGRPLKERHHLLDAEHTVSNS